MPNSILLSENSIQSLQDFTDFENQVIPESVIEAMPLLDVKTLMTKVVAALGKVKEEKSEFMLTTKLVENTQLYRKKMWSFELRRRKIAKNYTTIERRLTKVNQENIDGEERRKSNERNFLFYFWRSAQKILDAETYKNIVMFTERRNPMPETLKSKEGEKC